MKLYLYNTLTRQKEEFVPLVSGKVGMYSCGPTVYWTPHIGNLRATFTADLLRNAFQLFGYEVTSVMNITDVGHLVGDGDQGEDKLEKGAKRDGLSASDVAKKYEELFKEGMKKLNVEPFTYMPRATEHIEEQIALIQNLESKGYTYEVAGDGIYMDTSKVENYGELMGANYKKRLADLQAGERVDMGGKKNPTDFALWKFSPTDEKRQMERPSPRGIGFPGWHIECSAMSSKYLGEQFDLHHGGSDHITIHHPNEIAQSECAFGHHPWVKYRVHNEFLNVDGGKMGKSLGNAWTLEDIESRGYSALDLRYFYFMAQFGNFQNFTWEGLSVAKKSRTNLSGSLVHLKEMLYVDLTQIDSTTNIESLLKTEKAKEVYNSLKEILSDNLNTPKFLSEIFKLVNEYSSIESNSLLLSHYGLDDKDYLQDILFIIYYFDIVLLKLELFNPSTFQSVQIPMDEWVTLKELAKQRLKSKEEKNYLIADSFRKQLEDAGFTVLDKRDEKGEDYIDLLKDNNVVGTIKKHD